MNLPPELISSIISLSVPSLTLSTPDQWAVRATTLRSLSLVSPFRLHAQALLFNEVVLTTYDSMEVFVNVVHEDEGLGSLVRRVCIDGGRLGAWTVQPKKMILLRTMMESCKNMTMLYLRSKNQNLDVLSHPG